MAWVAALVTVAGSAIAGSSASSSRKSAAKQEAALRDRELRIAEAENARGEKLFNEYEQTYLPREREFVSSAFNDQVSPELAAARATTDARAIQDQNRQSSLRDARRLGINPTSGAYAAMENQRGLSDVALELTGRDSARRAANDQNFQRQYTALSLGRNLNSQAGALTNSAANSIGGLADAASRRTDQASKLESEAYAGMGEGLGALAGAGMDAWRNRNKTTTSTTKAYGT